MSRCLNSSETRLPSSGLLVGVGHHVPVHFIQNPNGQPNLELLFNRPPSVVHEGIYLEPRRKSKIKD